MYEHKTIRESIHDDVMNHECFFDDTAFSQILNINGRKVRGILTQSKSTREYDSRTGLISGHGLVLFLRASEARYVSVNETIRINAKVYVVRESRILGDSVWRIELGAYES